MSADLHLHIRTDEITDAVLGAFFSNTLGSSWGPSSLEEALARPPTSSGQLDTFAVIADTPDIWIGSVSWLKAALTNDPDSYVPDPVGIIADLVGDTGRVIIDSDLIDKIMMALNVENDTGYSIATQDDVRPFLLEHLGKPVFCVSW